MALTILAHSGSDSIRMTLAKAMMEEMVENLVILMILATLELVAMVAKNDAMFDSFSKVDLMLDLKVKIPLRSWR